MIIRNMLLLSLFLFTHYSFRVAEAAAPDQAATPLDPPTQTTFKNIT